MKCLSLSRVAAMAFTFLLIPLTFAADRCISIKPGRTGSAILKEPGHYCLNQQMTIEGKYSPWVWEGPKYLSDDIIALVLAANDVQVDLQGNTIYSYAKEVMAGVQSALVNTGESTKFGEGMYGYRKKSWDAAYRNISVRNGSIDIKRGHLGVMFPGSGKYYGRTVSDVPIYFGPANTRPRQCNEAEFSSDILPPLASAYPVRNITLTNLSIRAPACGVVIQGAKTVIRDSVIETDSQVGVWIFGPDAVIENNTIIVHDREKDSIDPVGPHEAPIRLHQADGSIVRNNRIVMRTRIFSDTKGTAAIDMLDSKNVLIENNTIEGFRELLRRDSTSSSADHGNKIK